MTNVISFPRRIQAKPQNTVRTTQSKTLFVHVKRATMIAHLAGARPEIAAGRAKTR